MHDTVVDGHQRIGHRAFAVVVGMDSQWRADAGLDLVDDRPDLERHGAAVGVAQHDTVDFGILGGLERLQGVLWIGLVAVEKVLGVVDDLRHVLLEVSQGIVDQLQVLFQTDAQRLVDMEVPGLAEDGDDIGLGLDQGADIVVLVRRGFGPAGRTESSDLCLLQGHLADVLEKSDVLGIGARPAALDVVDPQFVELLGDADLVLDQKGDILGLGSVPQGGIVELDQTHRSFLPHRARAITRIALGHTRFPSPHCGHGLIPT